jgi:hypothetical protein
MSTIDERSVSISIHLSLSIEHDGCLSRPGLNSGSCFPDSRPDRVICLCTGEYFGSEFQSRRHSIRLSVSLIPPEHRGAVIQYLRIDFVSLDVHLVDEEVIKTFRQLVEYFYSDSQISLLEIVLAKLYSTDKNSIPADLFLLSVHLNISFLTGATQISEINRCNHQRTLSNSNLDLLPKHSIFLLSRFFTYSILEIARGKPRTHRICIFCKNVLCRQLLYSRILAG